RLPLPSTGTKMARPFCLPTPTQVISTPITSSPTSLAPIPIRSIGLISGNDQENDTTWTYTPIPLQRVHDHAPPFEFYTHRCFVSARLPACRRRARAG